MFFKISREHYDIYLTYKILQGNICHVLVVSCKFYRYIRNDSAHYIHSAILDLSVLLIRSGVIQLCIILTVAGKIQRLCCAVFLQQIHIFSKRVSGYIHSKNRLL